MCSPLCAHCMRRAFTPDMPGIFAGKDFYSMFHRQAILKIKETKTLFTGFRLFLYAV